MTKLCNHDEYWHQRRDAAGVLSLLPEQKMTAAIRMLAYGSCADQCVELTRMGESTTLECLKKWCAQVVEHHKDRYLRSPNAADLSRAGPSAGPKVQRHRATKFGPSAS
ncbi:hypothetical protein QQ045_000279 [Rhodiola kirilowii]